MFENNRAVLSSLRDFIGDALSESDISPSDIIDAIQDELRELIDYHKIQGAKAQKVLDMIKTPDDVITFSDRFHEIINNKDVVDDVQDSITFGNYDFSLGSDYLPNPYKASGNDVIKFDLPDDEEKGWKNWNK